MKTARGIVRDNQEINPKDSHKSYRIIHRDPVKGDLAAEIALSGWSGKWLVAVYHEREGAIRRLWLTGLDSKNEAITYVEELKDLVIDLGESVEIDEDHYLAKRAEALATFVSSKWGYNGLKLW
jgi:hypothetical protein